MKENRWILYSGVIAICFLWTGAAYISQVYRLFGLYDTSQMDIISQVLYYLMQALGLAVFSVLIKRFPGIATDHRTFIGIILAEAVVVPIVLTVHTAEVILTVGFLMNFLHGAVAGCYLMQLSAFVPKEHRGKAFGFGYAVGSIGTWIMSMSLNGRLLQSKAVIIVYLFLMALSIVLVKLTERIPKNVKEYEYGALGSKPVLSVLIFLSIVLLTFTKGIGFYFPTADIGQIVNMEFSRAFYALGLVVAGVINDKSRKFGASLALVSIIFPFIAIALSGNRSFAAATWILGYIFFGLLAVYRVIVFADVGAGNISLLPVAGFGLIAGRIGDALGTIGGILCKDNLVLLLTVTGMAAVIMIPFFLNVYHRLYATVVTEEQSIEARCKAFEVKHGFSGRECEVFRLLIDGCSNLEIADKLYISESTVKFHVSNILKKTGRRNRTGITALFEKD
jgi:DNA-binding CsgD family transcriptional regulator/MFS family permease